MGVTTDGSIDEVPVGRSAFALVRDRQFGVYFWANIIANSGVWGVGIAAVVVVFQMTGSAQMVGLVSVVQFAAPLVLAPVGGLIADRFDPRRVLLVTHVFSASALIGLSMVLASGPLEDIGPAPILITCFALGVSLAVTDPSRHSIVPNLVAPPDVGTAVSLNTVTFNIGRAIGPGVAGVLLSVIDPAGVFAVAAGAYLTFAAAVLLLRPRPRTGHATGSILGGLRYVREHRYLIWLLGGVTAAGCASDPVITLVPLMAQDMIGSLDRAIGIDREALAVGVLASSFGAGAVCMAFAVTGLHRRWGYNRSGSNGLFVLGCALVVLAFSPTVFGSIAVLMVGGAGYLLAVTSFSAALQTTIPNAIRGRVMALWGVCFLGSRPLSAWVDSTVAHLTTARIALVVPVMVAVAVGCAIRLNADRAQADDAALGT